MCASTRTELARQGVGRRKHPKEANVHIVVELELKDPCDHQRLLPSSYCFGSIAFVNRVQNEGREPRDGHLELEEQCITGGCANLRIGDRVLELPFARKGGWKGTVAYRTSSTLR